VKFGVSPGIALRLARLWGDTPETWLRMQEAYDLGMRASGSSVPWTRLASATEPFDPGQRGIVEPAGTGFDPFARCSSLGVALRPLAAALSAP